MITPHLPGAISCTHLKVYDTPSPGGLLGGSPHCHFACSEAYYVLSGRGSVQLLDRSGFREVVLRPGNLLSFSAGVIHRLVNLDTLEILVLMSNAGLPEHGDAIFCFPDEVLRDGAAYWKQAVCAEAAEAYERRNLAVRGFEELKKGDTHALETFYQHALELLLPKLPFWNALVEQGTLQQAKSTLDQLDRLQEKDLTLFSAQQALHLYEPATARLGMCGVLFPYQVQEEATQFVNTARGAAFAEDIPLVKI